MEIEQRQAQSIEQLVKQASTLSGSSLASLIVQATSNPSLFSFSDLLELPNLLQLLGTENSAFVELLRLFAYGTWHDYRSNPSVVPQLTPDQELKLKQLTVLTLAETNKVLSYDKLLDELEVSNVRELEDFLIECMYAGIIKGKLDQLKRCFKVESAAGRDLIHGRLGNMTENLENWLVTSDNLLHLIKEKIEWADKVCQLEKDHQEEVNEKIVKAKKSLDMSHHNMVYGLWGHSNGYNGFGEEDNIRSKRRRSPMIHRQRAGGYNN